ncbi:FKBP12-associated 1 [Lecanosticta acicola]|uniref:FKBP12-associated 1 n=1 Tax=Lecanosticta acicola TaxID=111012 RepID=A0AAI8YTB6_9PEZI|nr:FKBP12-associated 1 [Lecanosticta acicola]
MRCNAFKSSEGNLSKSLPCNEECARLERNRKLALALNIDQSSHVDGGDHIPYSNDTLNIFAQRVKWAQTQEREFRVFAAADDEKRLRFKPMHAQQRAFIHALAEDFGFDSDSVDPEPHRHVMIWKTPRFVSAPNKTLADALRLRQQTQRSTATSANASDNEGANSIKAKAKVLEPYNSFRITKPRFGLTIDEVRTEVNTVLPPSTPFTLDIEFLPSEDIVLKAVSRTLSPAQIEPLLQNLKMALATAIAAKGYGTTQLCTTDSSLNITRYESDTTAGDGWSRVAAKKAAPKVMVSSTGLGGATNSFTPLSGGKVTFAKKKPKAATPIVDDWEAAEMEEEEKERVATSASEDEGGASIELPEGGSIGVDASGGDVGPQESKPERKDWADEVESTLPVSEELIM